MPLTLLPDHPFVYADLPDLGLTRKRLRRFLADGAVRRVFRGVYAPTQLDDTLDLRVAAANLVVADGHVAIDRTAAWIHGLSVYSASELEIGPVVETCALRGRRPTERGDVDGRSRDLSPDDIMSVCGVRVTTPLRTALDLGCNLRRREAYAALCQFARHHAVSAQLLARSLPRFAGRRGVVQLRDLIPLVDPRLESFREAWTLLEIHDAGLPHPTPQVWIEIDGVPTYRLDFAYARARICVEYDGFDAHERSEEQRAYDRDRRRWLRDHGWTVIVVRLGDFTGESLDRWLGELREALRSGYTTRRW